MLPVRTWIVNSISNTKVTLTHFIIEHLSKPHSNHGNPSESSLFIPRSLPPSSCLQPRLPRHLSCVLRKQATNHTTVKQWNSFEWPDLELRTLVSCFRLCSTCDH